MGQHAQTVTALAFNPDGRVLLSASDDGTIRAWDLDSRQSGTVLTHRAPIRGLALSRDAGALVFGTTDGLLALTEAGAESFHGALTNEPKVLSLAWSPSDQWIATASPGTVEVRATSNGRRLARSFIDHHAYMPVGLAFSPDRRHLGFHGGHGRIGMVDLTAGTEPEFFPSAHRGDVYALAFSPDGETLVSRSWDLRVWDVATRRNVVTLTNHTAWISSVAFAPNGKTLTSAGADQQLILWDTGSGERSGVTLPRARARPSSIGKGEQHGFPLRAQQAQQMIGGQPARVLGTFQQGTDVPAERFRIQAFESGSDQVRPIRCTVASGPAGLIQRILQQEQVRLHGRALREIPH